MGCWCMAWWRRGRRGNRDSAGLILSGEQCRSGNYGRLSRSCRGFGCRCRAGSGTAGRPGSTVTREVPQPGRRCLWGAYSADIPENAPHRRGRRRAAGYGPENDSAVTAAPGAPRYPGQATAPAEAAVRGTGPGRSGAALRRAVGHGAENDSAVTAAPGAPRYRARPQRPRRRRCAERGGERRAGGDRGRRRGWVQLPSGLPGRPAPGGRGTAGLRPGPRDLPSQCLPFPS